MAGIIKSTEEELLQTVSLLSSTLESTADGILVVDRDGKIVISNSRFSALWQIPEDLIQQKDDKKTLENVLEQLSEPYKFIEKVTYLYEHFEETSLDILNFKDGRVFERYSCPQYQNGEIVGRVWSFRDITDQRRIEIKQQESLHFLQTLIDSIPNPIFYKDAQAVYQGCNKAFEAYLGKDKCNIVGKSVYNMAPKELADTYHKMDSDLFNAGGVQIYESRVKYADGTFHDVIFNKATYFNTEGSLGGLVGVILDISARKQLENDLRILNEQLEEKVEERTSQLLQAQEELIRKEKLATLGNLSGSVGHELRNPLGVMNNAIYYLNTILPDADETTKEYLGIIKQEIDSSLRIINDLLDFARTKPPQTKTIIACELINVSLKKCEIPENVLVQTDIPESAPLLMIDPLQITQVLQNLITNGIQAMPEGGEIRIAARYFISEDLHLQSPTPSRDFVKISISDTGEGIAPENMKKLFQPLFTTKARGIGLGLVVCKNLVEANGGRIEVESEVGKGTTFTLVLPVDVANQ